VAVSDPTWLATFRTHRRSAPGYRAGRILLAGDAVHIHSPAGGQGMNTGLLDAHNLAWKLAAVVAGEARDDLLDSYGAERGPVAGDVLALSHRLVRLSSLSAPWQRALRGALVPVMTRLPGVRTVAARRISQVYVHYRRGPLTLPAGGALRPGDRAPDTRGLRFGGEPVRLHELLRGPAHTLLVLGHPPAPVAHPHVRPVFVARNGCGVATDVTGETHRVYRAHGGVHLVRPDGYLAASGVDAVGTYLDRVFGPSHP
jgi:4,5-epoxidase